MARTNETTIDNSEALWGTWEELLLACAVNRYGAQSWDSVAVEIQNRCSGPPIRYLITPKNCEQKYLDLKRRYAAGDDDGETETIPWLEELKKLRMAELKLELERYDLSIVSLQLKVKRLKEERQGSTDLEKKTESKCDPDKMSPELVAGKSNQSSNSTDVKGDNVQTATVTVKLEREAEPVQSVELNREPNIVKPNREGSCNGSSDSIAKERVLALVKTERGGGASESPELESVAESGGRTGKENSDVQSSVSKLKKEGDDLVLRGSSVGNDPENEDDQSPATKAISVKSQPLVDVLEIVRSHKLGSVFTSRLISQESTKYKNLIRQHLDLEILQKRLDQGLYSDGTLKFRRDLLVIINNALVFFKKNSSEYVAATEIRHLVAKHMAQINSAPNSSKNEKVARPNLPLPYKKTSSDSLLVKPGIPAPATICKKRSSITSKKKDETTMLTEEKKEQKPVVKPVENQALKKQTRDGFSTGSKNVKKTCRNPNKNSEESSDHKKKNRKNPNTTDVKKQGAAIFLNRIKKSLPSGNIPSIETSSDNKKNDNNNNKRSFGGRQQKEESPKKVTGRPPKRAAAQPPLPVSGKRSREAEASAKPPKKKTRK